MRNSILIVLAMFYGTFANSMSTAQEEVLQLASNDFPEVTIVKIAKKLREIKDELVIRPSFYYESNTGKIDGTARLRGHLEIQFEEKPLIKDGTEMVIMTADLIEGVFGSMSQFTTIIQPRLVYSPTSVKLVFQAQPYTSYVTANEEVARALALLQKARECEHWQAKLAPTFMQLDNVDADDMDNFVKGIMKTPAYIRLENYKFD